jgi:hypothetical protein
VGANPPNPGVALRAIHQRATARGEGDWKHSCTTTRGALRGGTPWDGKLSGTKVVIAEPLESPGPVDIWTSSLSAVLCQTTYFGLLNPEMNFCRSILWLATREMFPYILVLDFLHLLPLSAETGP